MIEECQSQEVYWVSLMSNIEVDMKLGPYQELFILLVFICWERFFFAKAITARSVIHSGDRLGHFATTDVCIFHHDERLQLS